MKKRLGRPLAFVALAAAFTLALGANAHAASVSIVKTSNIESSPGVVTTAVDVNVISGNDSLGYQFVNNTVSNVFGTFSTTPETVRVVGSNRIDSYNFRLGGGDDARYLGLRVAAVFAIDGHINSTGQFFADEGRVAVFTIPGSYNQFNPTSWGATNALGTTLNTPIAVWDLKPAEPVLDCGATAPGCGGPGTNNLTASQVNQLDVNKSITSRQQGDFLFLETQTFTGPTLSGNNYVTVTGNAPIPPVHDEGLISNIKEEYTATPNVSFIDGTGKAGFKALNTIASALGALPDLGGATTGFATAYGTGSGGSGNEFHPAFGLPPSTADTILSLGTNSSPTIEVTAAVPEPATITLFLCGGLAACGLGGMRRFRSKQTKAS